MTRDDDVQDKLKRRTIASQAQTAKKTISKQRVRPSVKANERQQQRQQRTLPTPPARRPAKTTPSAAAPRPASSTPAAAATGGVEPAERVRQLQNEFANLEAKAQLSQIYDTIGTIEKNLMEFPLTLEKLRDQGYVHNGGLEDLLESLDDKWDELRPRVESALQTHVQRLDRELEQADRTIDRMQPNAQSIRLGETMINSLSGRVTAAIDAVSGLYQGVENELNQAGWTLSRLTQMMDLIAESPHIRLQAGEGPLVAVKAIWHRDGDKGPEGITVLTDQRFFFEQREEVVTKRKFGLFKAESEMIQELHIEAKVSEIEQVEAKEEGGFLGMGKADILEMVFAATAPVSRARFHLKGQESADWAALIKKAQTGEIDGDRADAYVDELEALAETAASFPTSCPNCFAAVEPPARGVTSVTCDFCGAVITPQ
ncbi:MAG: hypothetical protein KC443_11675 [Anaerolineales bacterium]|nr:hypothetical protein [Anaerolineales bacterium]